MNCRRQKFFTSVLLALFAYPALYAQLQPLSVSVSARGVTHTGGDTNFVAMIVEQYEQVNVYPLLPYVFFGEDSADIPSRYGLSTREEISVFDTRAYRQSEQLVVYHRLLNIIGQRMRDSFPQATLMITGCNDGSKVERTSNQLSIRRAQEVQTYLVDVWGIDKSRLEIRKRGLPEIDSRGDTESDQRDAAEENRRVEISSNTWGILAPIELRDTTTRTNPPVVRFTMAAVPADQVLDWDLRAWQGERQLFKSFGAAPMLPWVDWYVEENPETIPDTEQPVLFELLVKDKSGAKHKANGEFHIERRTILKKRRDCIADREFDHYRLILFAFNSADISSENGGIIERLRGRIAVDGVVSISITGYTDRVGDSTHNQKLSYARARKVAEILKRGMSEVNGMGEMSERHDNDLPEGRFYSRTVDIDAAIPIKQPCK